MEEFQEALLRLMTTKLTPCERIYLIGQLQFAIVLLQKQQKQYEEKQRNKKRENQDDDEFHLAMPSPLLRDCELEGSPNEPLPPLQASNFQKEPTGGEREADQHPEGENVTVGGLANQAPPQESQSKEVSRWQEDEERSRSITHADTSQQQRQSEPPKAPEEPTFQIQQQQQEQGQQEQQQMLMAQASPILSVDEGLDVELKLELQNKELEASNSSELGLKCPGAPPQDLLQQRDEDSSMSFFHSVTEERSQTTEAFEAAADALDGFQSQRWSGQKSESGSSASSNARGGLLSPAFCPPQIEVIQLPTSQSSTAQSSASPDGDSTSSPGLLGAAEPPLPAFTTSPREPEEDPLLAPITLETEVLAERSGEVGAGSASGFPSLRVSLRSKRKARKPRRMAPQEDTEEDDLSPYHVCPLCDLVWRRTNDYVCHLLSHSPAPVTCARCKGTFENAALLRSHECFEPNQALFFRRLCGYCDAGFVNKKAFNRHKRTAHAFAIAINCTYCQKPFYEAKAYYVHLETAHVKKGCRVCRKCGRVAENDTALRQHMRSAHPSAGGPPNSAGRSRRLPFKCSHCCRRGAEGEDIETAAFATRAALRAHVAEAHQARCDDCGKNFRSSEALQRHRNVEHGGPPAAKRRRRGVPVAGKDGLVDEMASLTAVGDDEEEDDEEEVEEEDEEEEEKAGELDGERSRSRKRLGGASTNQQRAASSRARARRQPVRNGYKCLFCPARFHGYAAFRQHLQQNHAAEAKAGECRQCQRVFVSAASLEKHRLSRSHRQKVGEVRLERHHLCELCGRAYLRQQALQRHMKTHVNDYEFRCPHCDFKAVEKSNLKAHLSRHFDVKPFVCDKCSASFTSRRSLKDHCKFKHSEAREFFCETCGMGFKTLGTLGRHKKGHSTEKPYVCFCGTQFNRLSNLRRHLKAVHRITDDSVLPVKRLKKFGGQGGAAPVSVSVAAPVVVSAAAPIVSAPEAVVVPTSAPSQLMQLPVSSPSSSVLQELQALPVQPQPRTPDLAGDDDSAQAVLHSFLSSDPPVSSASAVLPQPQLFCGQGEVTAPGPMLRSLVGAGEDFTAGQPLSANHAIWRPMVSAPPDLVPVSTGCDVSGQVGACPIDPVTAGSTALPFDDVLWSSAVLPQTGGLSHGTSMAPTNGSSAITYLLSGVTSGGSVSLVGQTDSSGQVLFNSGGIGANSGGELSSTLMISHLTSELHSLNGGGALVSPTLQPITTTGQLSANEAMPQQQLQQQQQPSQPSGHQCSDFSVCYLIGGQNHVK